MSNSAANTDYPCRKATCCGEDDPFPNFTQGLLPYRISLQGIRCVSTYTPPLPAPTTDPEFNGDCMGVTTECIKELLTVEDECGIEWTSEAYVCAVQKALEICGDPTDTQFCNDEQTCCVTCPDGTVNCYTIAAGTICSSSKALANAQAYDIACQRAEEFKMCVEGCPTCCCVGDAYSFTFTIDGGLATKTIEVIDGALPPGLSLTGATVAGVPTLAGNWTFSIRVDDGRMQAVKTCTMYAIEISTTSLNDYTAGVAFSQQLQVTGGSGNYVWRIQSGTLPTGLTMTVGGLISGTPTGSTTETVVFEVVDTSCQSADRTFYVPSVTMTGQSVTRIAILRGFSEYIASSPPKKYKALTWTGESEQTAFTLELPPRQCGGAKYIYNGTSRVDSNGVFTSRYRKDFYAQCNELHWPPIAASVPLDINIGVLIGYCWEDDPNSCSECPTEYPFVADRAGNSIYDPTDFLDNPANGTHLTTSTSYTNNSTATASVALANVINFPDTEGQDIHPHWAGISATHNYSSTLSEEYTDAEALANALTYTSFGLVAENKPRTTGFVSQYTSVQYSLQCTNLVIGETYGVSINLWSNHGVTTSVLYTFTAIAPTHTITGAVPTPQAGDTLEARNPHIYFI